MPPGPSVTGACNDPAQVCAYETDYSNGCRVQIQGDGAYGPEQFWEMMGFDHLGRLHHHRAAFELDSMDRTVRDYHRQASCDFMLGRTITYDAYGNSLIEGAEYQYEGELVVSIRAADYLTTFRYEDPQVPKRWTMKRSEMLSDPSQVWDYRRQFLNGKLASITSLDVFGDVSETWAYAYEGEAVSEIVHSDTH